MTDIYKERSYKRMLTGISFVLRILVYILIVLSLVYASRRAYRFGYALFHEEAAELPPGRDIAVIVPEDADTEKIARILEAEGLIKDADIFVIRERLSDAHGELKSGSYLLNTSMTADELIEILAEGET